MLLHCPIPPHPSRQTPLFPPPFPPLHLHLQQKPRGESNGKAPKQTVTVHLHLHYYSWYISWPSSTKQQREMTKFCDVQRTRSTSANLFYFISNFSPVREDTKKQEKMTLECRRCPRRGSVVAPYSCLLCISPIPQGSTRFTHKDRKSIQVISKNDHY